MANIYAKSLTFPGLNNTYLFDQLFNGAGTKIQGSSCVNSLKTAGKYYYENASTILGDIPYNGFTVIIVLETGKTQDEVTQIAFGADTVYMRSYDGQAWCGWSSFGGTFMVSNASYGSTVPTSGTEGQVFYKLT